MIQVNDAVQCPSGYGTVCGVRGPFVVVRLLDGCRVKWLMQYVDRAREVTADLALRLVGINPDAVQARGCFGE